MIEDTDTRLDRLMRIAPIAVIVILALLFLALAAQSRTRPAGAPADAAVASPAPIPQPAPIAEAPSPGPRAADPPAPAGGKRRYCCLSLRVLEEQARGTHWPLPEVETLAGINYLDFYVVDPATRDIILVGRQEPDRPPFHLDDLVVHLRNIWSGDASPYCSLDPQPGDVLKTNRLLAGTPRLNSDADRQAFLRRLRNTWGNQKTVIGGVPTPSRCAHVMIDADYHMKKLSQGLVTVEGIPSALDLSLADAIHTISGGGAFPDEGMTSCRLWFASKDAEPTFAYDGNAVGIERCGLRVLTERQRALANGDLVDSGGDDPNSQAFAKNLTEHLEETASRVPEYADLIDHQRLRALLLAIHYRHDEKHAGIDLGYFMNGYEYMDDKPMPPSEPGLANAEIKHLPHRNGEYILFPLICGGVSMDMKVTEESFQKRPDYERLSALVLKSRPSPRTAAWNVEF